jgi:hypothetical protein
VNPRYSGKEELMRVQVLSIIIITAVAALMSTLSTAGDYSALDQSSKFYGDCINKYISRCQTKAVLLKNLKFKNIQKIASEAQQKAAFLSENKDRLIHEMIAENIGKKQYKAKLYLNKRYKESNLRDDFAPSHEVATLGR